MSTIAIAETHADVHGLIVDTARRFRDSHGGEIEELIAEARLCFMLAYQDWNPASSSFTHWVRQKIWFGLLDTARRHAKRAERFPLQPDAELGDVPCRAAGWELGSFLGELGADARLVAELAIDPPVDVRLSAAQRRGEHNPRSIRLALVEYLTDLGWSSARVAESFDEIAENLS